MTCDGIFYCHSYIHYFGKWQVRIRYSFVLSSVSSYSYTSLLLHPLLSLRHCNAVVSHTVAGNFNWRRLWNRIMREGHERDGAKGRGGQKWYIMQFCKKWLKSFWKPEALEDERVEAYGTKKDMTTLDLWGLSVKAMSCFINQTALQSCHIN